MSTLLDVQDWAKFVIHLPNITSSDVERIKQDHPLSSACEIERMFIEYWLDVYHEASWTDVALALYKVGELKLAMDVIKMVNIKVF